MPSAFWSTYGTPWRATGRQSYRIDIETRGPFWARRRIETVVLQVEEERLAWRSAYPRPPDDPVPPKAKRATRWRDATAADILPIEKRGA